ncbi:MAG: hypothetical protein WD872_03630 [Pirellulaceae bacterium]
MAPSGHSRLVRGVSLLAWLALFCGCSSGDAAPGTRAEQIVIPLSAQSGSPTRIDLGQLDASRKVERLVLIENQSAAPRTIARIQASCECLSFRDALVVIEPNQTARATLVVDLTDDPDFAGLMGIQATGFDPAGQPVFAAVISIRASALESPGEVTGE